MTACCLDVPASASTMRRVWSVCVRAEAEGKPLRVVVSSVRACGGYLIASKELPKFFPAELWPTIAACARTLLRA